MELSYWEYKTWLSNVDFTVVGSGIVGLSCAYYLKTRFPKCKVLVLEKGTIPQGASTKNAGFACFGSISEVLSDMRTHSEAQVFDLVKQRWEGIQMLRELLGDTAIDFQQHGGHELFPKEDLDLYNSCLDGLDGLNKLLQPIFGKDPFKITPNVFQFGNIHQSYITHSLEGQLDTGNMMDALLQKCRQQGVCILNGISVEEIQDVKNRVALKTHSFSFHSKKLCIATNGFASTFLKQAALKPARAQVLITQPIKGLKITGTFHFNEGFYYFRNVGDRILFGGGRNLDFKTEETTDFGATPLIQNELERLLRTLILPKQSVEIDCRWTGIMGVGLQKTPIVEQVSDNVYCGIRLGGMGIALGSLVGKKLAELID